MPWTLAAQGGQGRGRVLPCARRRRIVSHRQSESVPVKRIFDCPCCGKSYVAKVVFSVLPDADDILSTPGSEQCGQCHEPCCPRCEFVGGETIICTRCTNYRDCTHRPEDRGPFRPKTEPVA